MTRREDGFTLIELMVAMVISMVTLLAAFQALDTFTAKSATVQARSDNTQRARRALDVMVRALRSQACTGPGGTSVLGAGTGAASSATQIAFVTDLGDGTAAPEKRVISWNSATRKMTDARYPGTRSGQNVTFAATPSTYGSQVDDVEPDALTPIFGYYAYDTATPPRPEVALPAPLSDADLGRVARITVRFRVGPAATARNGATAAVVSDEVFLRSADPADPAPLPLCP